MGERFDAGGQLDECAEIGRAGHATHQDLTDRARLKSPTAIHVSVENFLGSPRYDEIVEIVRESHEGLTQ